MSAISNPAPSPLQRETKVPAPRTPPMRKPASPLKWVVLMVLLTGAWAGYEFWYSPRQAQQKAIIAVAQTAKVTTGALTRTVRLTGQTAAKNYANIIAPMLRGPEGRSPLLLLKLVTGGSQVRKGDLLAQIDAQSSQDHIDDVKAMVLQAEGDVKKRQAELQLNTESLLQTLRSNKADMEKSALDLKAAEVRTEVERELLKISVAEATARYQQVQRDLETIKISQKSELRMLEITKIRQDRHLGRHASDVLKFTIKSPMDGLVVMQSIWGGSELRQIQEGDNVFAGQPFMKVVNPASMQIEANVNQAEIGDFRVNQSAVIRLDAFPGMEFPGKIYSIGAMAVGGWRQNFFIRNVPIRIAIQSNDPHVIPDLNGSGEVLLGKADNATIVPLGAVSEENGKEYVSVKQGQGFEKRPVTLGLKNDTHAAVLSGLAVGEEVRMN
jgi:HlyD family secretion protein